MYTGTSGSFADYIIKGTHIYSQSESNLPIVVYVNGPDGTSISVQSAYAEVAKMPSGIPGTAPAQGGTSQPENVVIQVSGTYTVNAQAGTSTGTVQVATLSASVNGKADQTVGDFQAQINWGDSGSWSAASLTFVGVSGTFADYNVYGSYTYQQAGTDIPIIVYANGPDGTSTSVQTADAEIAQATVPVLKAEASFTEDEGHGPDDPPLATFQDPNPPTGLKAEISYGDGTPPTSGTIVPEGGGTYVIDGDGTHQYPDPGPYQITVTLTDPQGQQSTIMDSVTVDSDITLGPLTPAQWTINEPNYEGSIAVSGGSGTYSNLNVTGLPSGLSANLSGDTIEVTGTPTESGTFSLTASVQDSNGASGTGTDSLTINAAQLNLGPLNPATWTANQPGYNGTIEVSGGSGSYSLQQVSGLPAGLAGSLSGSTVIISGTPTQSGTFSVGISVEDSQGVQGNETCSLTINSAVTLGSLSPNEWTAYKPGYKGVIAVSGGSGSYSNAQVSGLPDGLSAALDGSDIDITGTPTKSGTFMLQVSIADSNGATATSSDSLTVDPAVLTFGPLTPGEWQVNQSGYDGVISISGGSGSYTNLQVSGLPAGLTPALAGSSIDVTGTPSTAGTFSIGLSVEDANGGASGTGTDTLTVTAGSDLTLGNLAPTQWTVNNPGYSGSISVSGGNGSYRGLEVSGLPAGLSASLSGHAILIRGTPTQQGTFKSIAVTLQDSEGESGSGTYSMTINPAITLGDLDPTEWDVNQPGYDGTISVSGGTGSYSNLKVTGLPAGLAASVLSSVANVNGTPVLSGLISITGTPTKSGVFPLDVSLNDATGATNQSAVAATAKAGATVVSLTGAPERPVRTNIN